LIEITSNDFGVVIFKNRNWSQITFFYFNCSNILRIIFYQKVCKLSKIFLMVGCGIQAIFGGKPFIQILDWVIPEK